MPRREPRQIVLVVDDSPETLNMLTDAIEDAGMTVLVALAGEQALAMLERVTPDVILMDAVMPGIDGFETCRRLKRDTALAHVPVIFMTGLSETEDVVHGLQAGGVDYVTKPIVPEELIARIRVHLANARMALSARAALDASGRFLLAADHAGQILWCTPQAANLLRLACQGSECDGGLLPANVQAWLRQRTGRAAGGREPTGRDAAMVPETIGVEPGTSVIKLGLSYIGQIGPDEILLRLVEGDATDEQKLLRRKLALTQREAEVLLWIARGKSNRDIGEILALSPRTVNKHLEQIFSKLGVENRTSAATLAMCALGMC
jgi:DNA-binding NarL/FixJ family response regulator